MNVSFFEARCAVQKFFINMEYLPMEMRINKAMRKIRKDKAKSEVEATEKEIEKLN